MLPRTHYIRNRFFGNMLENTSLPLQKVNKKHMLMTRDFVLDSLNLLVLAQRRFHSGRTNSSTQRFERHRCDLQRMQNASTFKNDIRKKKRLTFMHGLTADTLESGQHLQSESHCQLARRPLNQATSAWSNLRCQKNPLALPAGETLAFRCAGWDAMSWVPLIMAKPSFAVNSMGRNPWAART